MEARLARILNAGDENREKYADLFEEYFCDRDEDSDDDFADPTPHYPAPDDDCSVEDPVCCDEERERVVESLAEVDLCVVESVEEDNSKELKKCTDFRYASCNQSHKYIFSLHW